MSSAAIHQNSSDSTPISNHGLSPAQSKVVVALARGESITAAAEKARVHRTTVHHWFRHEPNFKAALLAAQKEYVETLEFELHELSRGALRTLRELVEDRFAPRALRLKVALAILNQPRSPKPGWSLPEQVEVLPAPQTEPPAPRNAPCPCGSGLKFKRCCAGRAPLTRPAALKLAAPLKPPLSEAPS